ncbi:hypothetical protein GCM10022237_02750 [Nocardioides ginsengisoli]|uniref:DUF559 domain-containing protein n=1 Tax=Nocardioides ginsengisoli TaxID=363868 RepID=A0ABW3W5X6_9ACTN
MEDPDVVVRESGGIVDAATLRRRCGAQRVRRAVDAGEIVLLRRGRYGVPGLADAARLAVELNGTISHLSAALAWGWQVKDPPDRPHLTLPRGRTVSTRHRREVHLHWQDRPPRAHVDARGVRLADPLETLVGCLRSEPFPAALSVADSALRSGRVRRADLLDAVTTSARTGRTRALRVARAADGRAANPFESCLRAICLDVRGLTVRPQVQIGPYRVDLADVALGIVIEADSRTWHAGPAEHDADIRRYTALVAGGWILVRFTHHDVMHDPAYVATVLADVVDQARRTRGARRVSDRTPASPSPGTPARPRRSRARRTPPGAAAPRRPARSR